MTSFSVLTASFCLVASTAVPGTEPQPLEPLGMTSLPDALFAAPTLSSSVAYGSHSALLGPTTTSPALSWNLIQADGSVPSPRDENVSTEGYAIEVVYQEFELDEVRFVFEDDTIPGLFGSSGDSETFEDIERETLGLRFSAQDEENTSYLHVFVERFDLRDRSNSFRADTDMFGGEIGSFGAARLSRNRNASPIIDYGFAFSYQQGTGNDAIDKIWFAEAQGFFGGGVDVEGIQIAGGVIGSALAGGFDIDPGDGDYLYGSNLGGYVRGSYRGQRIPLVFNVRGMFGDIRGVHVAVGLRF